LTLSGDKGEEFARRLLSWRSNHNYDHQFPWRVNSKDSYLVLISELFLRKTTRKQVEAILRNFLDQYRNFTEIETASVEDLEKAIRPLGMERKRAFLLKTLAEELAKKHGGAIPLSRHELMLLPGIGPYTANAVLCLSAGFDEPLVDTNTIRVITRVFSYKSSAKRPRTDSNLWQFVGKMIPQGKGRDFNLGLLDFAAEICTSRKPKCFKCPLADLCGYYQELLIFEKRLTKLEKKEHIICVPKQARAIFPFRSSTMLSAGKQKVSVKVDAYGRMNPSFLLWVQFLRLLNFNPDEDLISFKWISPKRDLIEVGVRKPTTAES